MAVVASDDSVTVAWALPTETPEPTLELFLIQKTPSGVETNKRSLRLSAYEGRIGFAIPALHTALAAVGKVAAGKFVPIAAPFAGAAHPVLGRADAGAARTKGTAEGRLLSGTIEGSPEGRHGCADQESLMTTMSRAARWF